MDACHSRQSWAALCYGVVRHRGCSTTGELSRCCWRQSSIRPYLGRHTMAFEFYLLIQHWNVHRLKWVVLCLYKVLMMQPSVPLQQM